MRVRVEDAAGLVTAEPVWATRSSPPFDAAAMDGIAVLAADTLGASGTTPVCLLPDAYDVVDTGNPMPGGRDAVVMREHVHYRGDSAELRAAAPPYQHVRSIGEDISAGELLLPGGHRLRAIDVAAAAAAGATDILVRRRPVVAILPTGAEVRPIGEQTGAGEITDTNSVMLATQAREAGCEARCLPIEPDDPASIARAVSAAASSCDLLIVVAGSSAGRGDYTARVVAELGTLAVHGVTMRPGHPVVLGVVGHTPVLGAPGYPLSAALAFDIFARPLLAELEGTAPQRRPRATVRLARKLASPPGLDDWVRVRLAMVGGTMVAAPLPRGAGALTSLVRADGLLVIPAGVDGHRPGEQVEVELLRGIDEISRTIVATGSHDLVLDLAASALRAEDPLVTLASSYVGSLGGLEALRDGLCHVAGSHLLDPATGGYTLPYLDRILPGADVCVVRLVHRDQGLIVAAGNPLGLTGFKDLTRAGVRYVNRQRGAGTRVLLDHELARRGISPDAVDGYAREELTHLAVAAAVAAGRGDAGLGIMAAASAFGLDFMPVTREPYDLVVTAEAMASPLLAPLWALLHSDRFQAAVTELGGYSTKEMGRRHAVISGRAGPWRSRGAGRERAIRYCPPAAGAMRRGVARAACSGGPARETANAKPGQDVERCPRARPPVPVILAVPRVAARGAAARRVPDQPPRHQRARRPEQRPRAEHAQPDAASSAQHAHRAAGRARTAASASTAQRGRHPHPVVVPAHRRHDQPGERAGRASRAPAGRPVQPAAVISPAAAASHRGGGQPPQAAGQAAGLPGEHAAQRLVRQEADEAGAAGPQEIRPEPPLPEACGSTAKPAPGQRAERQPWPPPPGGTGG